MRVFKDDHDPEMIARTWVALEARGRNPAVVLRCDRPDEPLLERARKQIQALDKAASERLPSQTRVVATSDMDFKVILDGQYCGRVEMDGRTMHWVAIDKELHLRAFNKREEAIEHLTLQARSLRHQLRVKKMLKGGG